MMCLKLLLRAKLCLNEGNNHIYYNVLFSYSYDICFHNTTIFYFLMHICFHNNACYGLILFTWPTGRVELNGEAPG